MNVTYLKQEERTIEVLASRKSQYVRHCCILARKMARYGMEVIVSAPCNESRVWSGPEIHRIRMEKWKIKRWQRVLEDIGSRRLDLL